MLVRRSPLPEYEASGFGHDVSARRLLATAAQGTLCGMTTGHDIARWRLHSQFLATPYAESSAAVVSGLLAVQAENPGQAAWAVGCRTPRPDPAELQRLLEAGEVIRTHLLRPTWHFVAAQDIGWLLELTAPRIRPLVLRQLGEAHGLAGRDLDRATSTLLDAVVQGPHQTRDGLGKRLSESGRSRDGLPLLLLVLELDRLICSGRPVGGTHTYAPFSDRVPPASSMDREEALAELALRYFTGHGPATERDLAYWATLPLGDVRRGLHAVRARLESFEHDGRTFWHAPAESPPEGELRPGGHLLQILDEVYRGYQDSRMVLDADGVVPTGRESTLGMALVDAQMVARVRRTVGPRVVFELTPYKGTLSSSDLDALEQAALRYADFLGLEHDLLVR